MDVKLIHTLFDYLKANSETTEDELKALVISQSDHTEATITEWLESMYKGLYEKMVIDKPTFDAMKNKIINHVDISIDKVLEVLEIHFKSHPLQYEINIKLAEIEAQIKTTELLPDQVMGMNHDKFMKLNELGRQREILGRLK